MKQDTGSYLHQLDDNGLSKDTRIISANESPPPYCPQAIGSDWKHEIVEIEPLWDDSNRFGFVISGGIDDENGPPIIITHIDYCSKSSVDNGRTKLQLFDRILSINGIDLIGVTHDAAVRVFSSAQGRLINLHLYRLNPRYIEHINLFFPFDMSTQSFGMTITGGLDHNPEDPGLFITHIEPDGLLASINQFRLGDRLLEIKTNYTSANLQSVTHSLGIQLIRRICQDSKRVTFVVAHPTAS